MWMDFTAVQITFVAEPVFLFSYFQSVTDEQFFKIKNKNKLHYNILTHIYGI